MLERMMGALKEYGSPAAIPWITRDSNADVHDFLGIYEEEAVCTDLLESRRGLFGHKLRVTSSL